eukprot:jgi/Botrbrau1/22123/Bobra.0206s0047.1
MDKAASIIRDMRTLMNRQTNVIKNLHRRVFPGQGDAGPGHHLHLMLCGSAQPRRLHDHQAGDAAGHAGLYRAQQCQTGAKSPACASGKTIHNPSGTASSQAGEGTATKQRPMLPSPEDVQAAATPPAPTPVTPASPLIDPRDIKEGKVAAPTRGGPAEREAGGAAPTRPPPASPLAPPAPAAPSIDPAELQHADGYRGIDLGRDSAHGHSPPKEHCDPGQAPWKQGDCCAGQSHHSRFI